LDPPHSVIGRKKTEKRPRDASHAVGGESRTGTRAMTLYRGQLSFYAEGKRKRERGSENITPFPRRGKPKSTGSRLTTNTQ